MEATTPTPRHNWFIFVMFLVMCLLIWCMTSCGVLKNHYLQKYCKEKDSISFTEVTVIDFDTVYKTINGEPIYIKSPCDSLGNLKPISIKRKKNGITATVTSSNNNLILDCDIDSLLVVNANLTKTIRDYKHTTQQVKVNELTKWQSFLIVSASIMYSLLALWLIIRTVKMYFKPL